jgi:hypothetical protein
MSADNELPLPVRVVTGVTQGHHTVICSFGHDADAAQIFADFIRHAMKEAEREDQPFIFIETRGTTNAR